MSQPEQNANTNVEPEVATANTTESSSAQPEVTQSQKASQTPLYIYILYLASALTGITFLVGGIWAYVASGEGGLSDIEKSHYENAKSIFLWGLIWSVAGFILTAVFIGVFILLGAYIWILYRSIKGLMRFNKGLAYE